MTKSNELIKQRALIILPHLIRYAQMRQTVSYKKIADIINVNPHTELPSILGYIRDSICDPLGMPRINAIVVNATTGKPGDGFIPEGAGGLTEDEKRKLYERFQDEAFLYQGWDKLLQELNLEPVKVSFADLDQEAQQYIEVMARTGNTGGEQEAHRKLKDFIARSPQFIGIPALKQPEKEHLFYSDDRCDILIELFGNQSAIVEIKVRQRGELVKGIYQLVKYRALLEAERTHGGTLPIELHLVAYDIPQDIQEFAGKFNISSHVINESLVK
jgi:hypothetical protein